MDKTDLVALMKLIGDGFPFTQDHYPYADLSTPEKTLAFAVSHSHKHMSKSTGRIGTQTENYDHEGTMDLEKLKIATAKSVVNALNLANALGMTAEELAELIPEVMK